MIGKLSDQTLRLANKLMIKITGGTLRKDGRVILFVTTAHPCAHKSGYALRSRIVWWVHRGEVITGTKFDIHHKNGDRSDDSYDNLEKLNHLEHAKHHNPSGLTAVEKICAGCGLIFKIPQWRLKDKSRGQYCSQECYQKVPKKRNLVKLICSNCKKSFEVTPYKSRFRICCSNSCANFLNWKKRR